MLAGHRPVMPTADEHASKCRGSTCSGLVRARSCSGRGLIRWMGTQSPAAVCALTYPCTHRRADSRLAHFAARPFKGNCRGGCLARQRPQPRPTHNTTGKRARAAEAVASGDAMPFGAGPAPGSGETGRLQWMPFANAMAHREPVVRRLPDCANARAIACPVAWE
jgi:hypothetical protein